MAKRLFFDCEFTGLHQRTTLISIGIVSECGKTFYAEFTDYDRSQVDEWIQENVISKLTLTGTEDKILLTYHRYSNDVRICANKAVIQSALGHWLHHNFLSNQEGGGVEFWSDCLPYDWVLLCELFGGAMKMPKGVYYIPFDICTLFKAQGIDPDINREKFVFGNDEYESSKHNALWDAQVIMQCYRKLMPPDKAITDLDVTMAINSFKK